MNKFFLIVLSLLWISASVVAQEEGECSELGVWLWRFEHTKQPSHLNLSRTIASMGGKRIYVKVADGGANSSNWSTLLDQDLIKAYVDEGITPWAWSYNYRGNVAAQAQALYFAAQTGYKGYVIDIEIEFNGEDQSLEELMRAFYDERERAIADGFADPDFPLYVTTWGNPILHNYRIDIIDKYVDGYMPQTYIEEWAGDHLTMIENCIAESKLEYESLGATKPIHNILSTAQQILTAEEITHFFELSGPESSLWRVPGGGVSQQVWDRWRDVDWEINFCQNVAIEDTPLFENFKLYPNPADEIINIQPLDNTPIENIEIYRQDGILLQSISTTSNIIDVSRFSPGMYYMMVHFPSEVVAKRFIKL